MALVKTKKPTGQSVVPDDVKRALDLYAEITTRTGNVDMSGDPNMDLSSASDDDDAASSDEDEAADENVLDRNPVIADDEGIVTCNRSGKGNLVEKSNQMRASSSTSSARELTLPLSTIKRRKTNVAISNMLAEKEKGSDLLGVFGLNMEQEKRDREYNEFTRRCADQNKDSERKEAGLSMLIFTNMKS